MTSEKLATQSCGLLGNLDTSIRPPFILPDDNNKEILPQEDSKKPSQRLSKDASKSHKKLKKKKPQVVFNVSDTKYDVVKYVGKDLFQWKLVYEPEGGWDIFWTDNAVHPETLARMLPYQKINHFPGMYSLARKNHLGRYLMRMRKVFPESYKFFPRTFLLPSEYMEFKAQFTRKSSTFIVKPEASCQGRGIFLTRTCDSIEAGEHYVVQKYIDKPFLIDGLKFDLRVYVLLAGCDPLRIYVYKDGLARFATEKYVQPWKNLTNMCMHLTNYAINKGNPNFIFNTSEENNNEGHKRSLKAVFQTLESQGHDIATLWKEIKKLIVKTFCSVQPILAHTYRACQADDPYNNMCFEVLGFDIMLDHQLKPWLLEVNHTPSFTTDTPFDRNIKMNVIKDALTIMNISHETKYKYRKAHRIDFKKRVLTGKTNRTTFEERQIEIEKAQKERDEWENKNMGGYEKVYPLEDPSQAEENYEEYLKETNRWWEEWTGTAQRRRGEKKDLNNKPLPMVFGRGTSPSPVIPTKQTDRSKETLSALLPKPKTGEGNIRPVSQGRATSPFLKQERLSVPRIRKTDQLIPGEQQVTLSSDWSPKQDATLSFREMKQSRKVFNTDGDERPPILDPNPSDVFVVEEDFDWSANELKDTKDISNAEDCMVRQRSKTSFVRGVGFVEANPPETAKQTIKEEERKADNTKVYTNHFFMRDVNYKIKEPLQKESRFLDHSTDVKFAYNRRNKNLMNLIRLKIAGGQGGYNSRVSAEIVPQNMELAQNGGKNRTAGTRPGAGTGTGDGTGKYPNIKINGNEIPLKIKESAQNRIGQVSLLLAKRRSSTKPLPKQNSFSLQIQPPQGQQRAHSNMRVNKLSPEEEVDYKDAHLSFTIHGHRSLQKTQTKKDVRGGPMNLMNNLLYSKEKFANMQKILDSFMSEERKNIG